MNKPFELALSTQLKSIAKLRGGNGKQTCHRLNPSYTFTRNPSISSNIMQVVWYQYCYIMSVHTATTHYVTKTVSLTSV